MIEIQKIKNLFNSSDINNHKLAYILAKSQLGMNDKEVCSLVLNDMKGWTGLFIPSIIDPFSTEKDIFNGSISSLSSWRDNDISIELLINGRRFDYFLMNDSKLGKRIDRLNNWFSKLDK